MMREAPAATATSKTTRTCVITEAAATHAGAHFHGPTPVEDNPKSRKMAYLQGLWGIVFLFLIKNLMRLVGLLL
jgi:hypothetical protein